MQGQGESLFLCKAAEPFTWQEGQLFHSEKQYRPKCLVDSFGQGH